MNIAADQKSHQYWTEQIVSLGRPKSNIISYETFIGEVTQNHGTQ